MDTHTFSKLADGFVRPVLTESVAEHLRRHIDRLGTHNCLPGEREISRQLKVSREVVRAALGIVEAEGRLERRRGSPTKILSKSEPVKSPGEPALVAT